MTPDGSPTRLPPDAEARLAELWRQLPSAGLTRESLRAVARAVGFSARHAGVLPERLIVAIKESWRQHAPMHGYCWYRADGRSVLAELISLCVAEYFRDGSGDGDGHAHPRAASRGLAGTEILHRADDARDGAG